MAGSSIAYFLRTMDLRADVTMLERDPTYARSSSAWSAALNGSRFPGFVVIGRSGNLAQSKRWRG